MSKGPQSFCDAIAAHTVGVHCGASLRLTAATMLALVTPTVSEMTYKCVEWDVKPYSTISQYCPVINC